MHLDHWINQCHLIYHDIIYSCATNVHGICNYNMSHKISFDYPSLIGFILLIAWVSLREMIWLPLCQWWQLYDWLSQCQCEQPYDYPSVSDSNCKIDCHNVSENNHMITPVSVTAIARLVVTMSVRTTIWLPQCPWQQLYDWLFQCQWEQPYDYPSVNDRDCMIDCPSVSESNAMTTPVSMTATVWLIVPVSVRATIWSPQCQWQQLYDCLSANDSKHIDSLVQGRRNSITKALEFLALNHRYDYHSFNEVTTGSMGINRCYLTNKNTINSIPYTQSHFKEPSCDVL